ncbi:AraC family transcriptional regulator [Paenibacillus sp. J31TS4]|uniref:response regulator transcription factor n=1 Tax=Paenibacillus sp. J31TS4 TaxID=2807195 RepID=UPI001B2DE010|nr:response regulator [Paenibacillus sp. J31TS4]GIP39821.1 AraC family transcriptional regulator [Paenibacillus sp. J31TS4]
MHKVLVVDDEAIVRITLKTIVPWERHGFAFLGSASNGAEALALFDKEAPDIVISDLKMPVMDGLELLRRLKERGFSGKTIVLSSYGEYELVREAMKLGAMDYLLKVTLEPEELIGLLAKVAEQLKEERSEQEKQWQLQAHWRETRRLAVNQYYRQLLLEELPPDRLRREAERLGVALDGSDGGYLLYLYIEQYEAALRQGKIKDKQLLGFSIHNIVAELANDPSGVSVAELSPRQFVVVYRTAGNEDRERQLAFAERIVSMLKLYLNLSVSAAVSGRFGTAEELGAAYRQCLRLMKQRFYRETGSVYHAAEAEEGRREMLDGIPAVMEEVRHALDGGRPDEAEETLLSLWERARRERLDPEAVKQMGTLLLADWQKLLMEWGDASFENRETTERLARTETLAQVGELLAEAVREAAGRLEAAKRSSYRKEINQVIAFLKERIGEKVTLAMLAAEVNMNESYLSRLFKQETGKTIVESMHQLKLEKARTLLRDPDRTVKEIAEEVGIDDPFYFNRLFNRYYGQSPTDYRKSLRK